MSKRSRRGFVPALALVVLCGACGDQVEIQNAGQGAAAGDAGPVAVLDAMPSAPPPVVLPDTGVLPPVGTITVDSGATVGIAIDASSPDAGGAARDAGPIVITIPTRSVLCGQSECTTTNNKTCCDAWSLGAGFAQKPACTTMAACTSEHSLIGETNRAVVNDCDEPSDCGAGQICCFVRYGMPISADLFGTELIGPGGSRMCMELSACNAGATTFTGTAGIPLGVVACKTDRDCSDGARCQAEAADSATTGKGSAARPGVMVCR